MHIYKRLSSFQSIFPYISSFSAKSIQRGIGRVISSKERPVGSRTTIPLTVTQLLGARVIMNCLPGLPHHDEESAPLTGKNKSKATITSRRFSSFSTAFI